MAADRRGDFADRDAFVAHCVLNRTRRGLLRSEAEQGFRERELIKLAVIASALAGALRARGVA